MISLGDDDLVSGTLREVSPGGVNDVLIEPSVPIQNFSAPRKFKLVDNPELTTSELEQFVDEAVLVGVQNVLDSVAEVIPLNSSDWHSFQTRRFLDGYCAIRSAGLTPGDSAESTFNTVLGSGLLFDWRDGEITGVRLEPHNQTVPGATYQVELLRVTPVETRSGILWMADARPTSAVSPPRKGHDNRIFAVHPPAETDRQHDVPDSLKQPRSTPVSNITVHKITENIGYEIPESAVECLNWGLCPTTGNTVEARITDGCRARVLGVDTLPNDACQFLQQTFSIVDEESYELIMPTNDGPPKDSVRKFDICSYNAHEQRARAIPKSATQQKSSTAETTVGGKSITDVFVALTCINRLAKNKGIYHKYPECKRALYDAKHYAIKKLVKQQEKHVLAIQTEFDNSWQYSISFSNEVCERQLNTEELRERVNSDTHEVWMYHVPQNEWLNGPPIDELPNGPNSSLLNDNNPFGYDEKHNPDIENGCAHTEALREALGRRADPNTQLKSEDYRLGQVIEDCI